MRSALAAGGAFDAPPAADSMRKSKALCGFFTVIPRARRIASERDCESQRLGAHKT